MNIMHHKGHAARIEFDERDNIFVGHILGLRTIISFHDETVSELRQEFESAIENFDAWLPRSSVGAGPDAPAS